jgi:hypothetical protein
MATDIRTLVETFVDRLVAAVEAESMRRLRDAVAATFGREAPSSRRTGLSTSGASIQPGAPVRHRPKQLCPVPGCTGVAAPVFGMVCAQHKDVPKSKIKEYRAQRRAEKADG